MMSAESPGARKWGGGRGVEVLGVGGWSGEAGRDRIRSVTAVLPLCKSSSLLLMLSVPYNTEGRNTFKYSKMSSGKIKKKKAPE